MPEERKVIPKAKAMRHEHCFIDSLPQWQFN